MENAVRPSTSEFEPLAFRATFDVHLDVAVLSHPVVTIEVTDSLSNTRVSGKDMIVGLLKKRDSK